MRPAHPFLRRERTPRHARQIRFQIHNPTEKAYETQPTPFFRLPSGRRSPRRVPARSKRKIHQLNQTFPHGPKTKHRNTPQGRGYPAQNHTVSACHDAGRPGIGDRAAGAKHRHQRRRHGQGRRPHRRRDRRGERHDRRRSDLERRLLHTQRSGRSGGAPVLVHRHGDPGGRHRLADGDQRHDGPRLARHRRGGGGRLRYAGQTRPILVGGFREERRPHRTHHGLQHHAGHRGQGRRREERLVLRTSGRLLGAAYPRYGFDQRRQRPDLRHGRRGGRRSLAHQSRKRGVDRRAERRRRNLHVRCAGRQRRGHHHHQVGQEGTGNRDLQRQGGLRLPQPQARPARRRRIHGGAAPRLRLQRQGDAPPRDSLREPLLLRQGPRRQLPARRERLPDRLAQIRHRLAGGADADGHHQRPHRFVRFGQRQDVGLFEHRLSELRRSGQIHQLGAYDGNGEREERHHRLAQCADRRDGRHGQDQRRRRRERIRTGSGAQHARDAAHRSGALRGRHVGPQGRLPAGRAGRKPAAPAPGEEERHRDRLRDLQRHRRHPPDQEADLHGQGRLSDDQPPDAELRQGRPARRDRHQRRLCRHRQHQVAPLVERGLLHLCRLVVRRPAQVELRAGRQLVLQPLGELVGGFGASSSTTSSATTTSAPARSITSPRRA